MNNGIWVHFHTERSGWILFSSVNNDGDEIANSAEREDPHKSRPENCPVAESDPSIFGPRPPWRPLPRVGKGHFFLESMNKTLGYVFQSFMLLKKCGKSLFSI